MLYFLNRLNNETHSRNNLNMTQYSTHDDLGHRNLLLKLENLLELAPLENLEAKDENVVVLQTEIFNNLQSSIKVMSYQLTFPSDGSRQEATLQIKE